MNASGWSPRLQRDKGIDMSLIPVDTALQAGITDIFAVAGEINPHLFTHPLEDLGHSPELGGIHVVDTQHRVLMALLRAKRRGATVRAGTDHLEREVCIVTMHADEIHASILLPQIVRFGWFGLMTSSGSTFGYFGR